MSTHSRGLGGGAEFAEHDDLVVRKNVQFETAQIGFKGSAEYLSLGHGWFALKQVAEEHPLTLWHF